MSKIKYKKNIKKKFKKKNYFKDYSTYYYITFISIIIIIFLISLFNTTPDNNDNNNNSKVFKDYNKDTSSRLEGKDDSVDIQEFIANYPINEFSSIDEFRGRKSVILFAGTYCGHCKAMVPDFKTQIWDNYKETTNIWIQVINDDKFDVEEIPQGLNKNLDFTEITDKSCNYIPSFVVLNEEGKVIIESCGSEKTINDIIDSLNQN